MAYTKKQIVQKAFSKIGYAHYIYDLMPEQLEDVLSSLDNMIGAWAAKGILIGYPLPTDPNQSDINSDSNIPVAYNDAVIANLAIRIAPDYGKTVSPEIKLMAVDGYNAMLCNAVMPDPLQLPSSMPAGSGNKYWRRSGNPYVCPPIESIEASGNTIDDLNVGEAK